MRFALVAALSVPTVAFAAGGDDEPPPKPTVFCTGSKVYDADKGKCVEPEQSSLNRDELYLAVRQLAYAGRYLDAQDVLRALPDHDPGRLTYLGFTHRKLGNRDLAMDYYSQAIDRDPANILARSYMGQGLVEEGKISQAMVQLHQIRAHGGAGSWAETSLDRAIQSGVTYDY